MDYIDTYMEKDGKVWNSLSFVMNDEDEDEHIADITRLVRRDENGMLHVKNEFLEIKGRKQGKGIGDKLYARSEQMWRQLSNGQPFEINLTANINVGTYAWATKGFDFADEPTMSNAQDDLKLFCSDNKIDRADLLERNGYKSFDDIKHPWQMAVLQNGDTWNLEKTKGDWNRHDGTLKGTGHFGKAFMLAGMAAWDGVRHLNSGSKEEQVYDPIKPRGKNNGE
jgi:hypothetical protein